MQYNHDKLTSVSGGLVPRQYTYRDISSTQTTMQVASVTSGGQTYSYTYDSMGNIATYAAPGKGILSPTPMPTITIQSGIALHPQNTRSILE